MGSQAPPHQVYRSSSSRLWVMLFGSLGFVAVAIFNATRGGNLTVAVLGAGFFGLNAVIFGALLLRPQTLVIDRDGFELGGGLLRAPHRTAWRDVRGFRVWRSGRWFGPKLVAYDYRAGWEPAPEAPRAAKLLKFNRDRGWPDAALPGMRTLSASALSEKLNDSKRAAAGETSEE
jgi:hypothetical protein